MKCLSAFCCLHEKQTGGTISIICKLSFPGRRGMRGDAHHRGAQHATVKHVAGLKFREHRAIGFCRGFDALDGVMKMRVEWLAGGFDALEALFRERVPELAMD